MGNVVPMHPAHICAIYRLGFGYIYGSYEELRKIEYQTFASKDVIIFYTVAVTSAKSHNRRGTLPIGM